MSGLVNKQLRNLILERFEKKRAHFFGSKTRPNKKLEQFRNSRKSGIALYAICLIVAFLGASAASAYEPERGSAERKAILDAIRPRIVTEMGGSVEFVVHHLQVDNGFAFAILDPQRPGGGQIRLEDTIYADHDPWMMDGLTVYALMRRVNGRWGAIASVTGPTDVAYWGWWDDYGAPRWIFP